MCVSESVGGSTGGGGGTGWQCHPVLLFLPPRLSPQTQKLLFKVPFGVPVACGYEIFLENECSLLYIEALYLLSRMMYWEVPYHMTALLPK